MKRIVSTAAILLIVVFNAVIYAHPPTVTINVDAAKDIRPLPRIWQSTGFSPANLLLSADMQQQMAYVGAMPNHSIRYVRIHYLLELLRGEGFDTDNPTYDFSLLDRAIDVLIQNNLKPFFELMGNPQGYFDNYENAEQVRAWRRLVCELANHYIAKYGLNEVRSWIFETWNEPNIGFWRQSEKAFMNYYDACSAGLADADEKLIFGGPGTTGRTKLSDLLVKLLEHCSTGKNVFTGKSPTRIDFISEHVKSVKGHVEDLNPRSMGMLRREKEDIEFIRKKFPQFKNTSFTNNECDPQTGWGQIHTWRAKAYYPAFICKVINQHLIELIDNMDANYGILSNDNAFLGTWGQRSLLTRFGELKNVDAGQSGDRSDKYRFEPDPAREQFELIKKPVFNGMELLGLLGSKRCAVECPGDISSDIGAIASIGDHNQVAVLIYHSRDQIMSSATAEIELTVCNIPFDKAMLVHYRIDDYRANPFKRWEQNDAPSDPAQALFAQMRDIQEPTMLHEPKEIILENGMIRIQFNMPLPAVSLVILSDKPETPLTSVQNLRFEKYKGLSDKNEQILLIWDVLENNTIRSYEVLYSREKQGLYKRINTPDLISGAFMHVADTVKGFYRIRAVDYWGRISPDSAIIEVK